MKKVFFLLNHKKDFNFKPLVKKYLGGVQVSVGDVFPKGSSRYDLIVLWSYRKILPGLSRIKRNVILFHSTDLPKGKGWAPIYHTIVKDLRYFTISGILANDDADAGEIIVKARFKMKAHYTAQTLRAWDEEISILLTKRILDRFGKGPIRGVEQKGKGSFYPRRRPEDNEITPQMSGQALQRHLRACEKRSPAFFYHEGEKYFVYAVPERKPDFPKDLKVVFYDPAQ